MPLFRKHADDIRHRGGSSEVLLSMQGEEWKGAEAAESHDDIALTLVGWRMRTELTLGSWLSVCTRSRIGEIPDATILFRSSVEYVQSSG